MSVSSGGKFKGGPLFKLAEEAFEKNRAILKCDSCGAVGSMNKDSVKSHRHYKYKDKSYYHTIGIKDLLELLKIDTSSVNSIDMTEELLDHESEVNNTQSTLKDFAFSLVTDVFSVLSLSPSKDPLNIEDL